MNSRETAVVGSGGDRVDDDVHRGCAHGFERLAYRGEGGNEHSCRTHVVKPNNRAAGRHLDTRVRKTAYRAKCRHVVKGHESSEWTLSREQLQRHAEPVADYQVGILLVR